MDKDLLLYYAKKAGKSREDLAKALNLSKKTIDNKLSGRTEFTATEIRSLAQVCQINGGELVQIFFADVVA